MPLNACYQSLGQALTILEKLDLLPAAKADNFFIELRVGKHLRHILDHCDAALLGIATGRIDYNSRQRNSLEERDRNACRDRLLQLQHRWPKTVIQEQSVFVISEVAFDHTQMEAFSSTVGRELLYVINHTIHHVAYVKLLLAHAGVELPPHIGLAPATASYERSQCAH